jgi:hypothetical protein
VGLVALAVVAALLAGATLWLGLLVNGQHGRNNDRDAAVAQAQKIITDYTTYDFNNADAQFAHLATEFSGPLKTQIQKDLSSVVALIKAGKGTAKGQVSDAAVVFQRGNTVSVLVAGDEAVTNTALPKGDVRRFRFSIVMTKAKGHWFGSTLDVA